ncbi:MAG: T9SS type A sorting domain-containing protein [Dysgonamonadaceae bacterium]|nr:T9SS type A sorting domain-containing protein [Dysgonamonadaceae bacterium]
MSIKKLALIIAGIFFLHFVNAGEVRTQDIVYVCSGSDTIVRIAPDNSNAGQFYLWQIKKIECEDDNETCWENAPGKDWNEDDSLELKNITTQNYIRCFRNNVKDRQDADTIYITVLIKTILPGIISSEKDTICYNTSVELSGTDCTGEGSNKFSYQWEQSDNNVDFSHIENADSLSFTSTWKYTTWFRLKYMNGCEEVYSDTIKITVLPEFKVGKIKTDSIGICYNSTETITIDSEEDPSGGDGIITYKWLRNNKRTGSDSTTYSGVLNYLNPGEYTFKRQAKDSTCNTEWTDSEGEYKVTVYARFTSGEIESIETKICFGNTQTIGSIDAARGGDEKITYQWLKNDTIIDTTSDSETYTLPENLAPGEYTFKRQAKDGTCKAEWIDSEGEYKVTVYAPFTSGKIGNIDTKICFGDIPPMIGSIEAASGGDEKITYQWLKDDIVIYTSDFETYTLSGNLEPGEYTFKRRAKDSTCNTEWTDSGGEYKVTVYDLFTSGEIESIETKICFGDTQTIGSIKAARGGDEKITYQWLKNGIIIDTTSDSETYTLPENLEPGEYTFKRQAKDSICNAEWTDSEGEYIVEILPKPEKLTLYGDISVCHNEGDVEYYFETIKEGIKYEWEVIGGDTTKIDINHIIVHWNYSEQGEVIVKQTNELNCSHSDTIKITKLGSAPDKTTIMKKGKSNILICDLVNDDKPKTYRWGFIDLVAKNVTIYYDDNDECHNDTIDYKKDKYANFRYFEMPHNIDTDHEYFVDIFYEDSCACITRTYYKLDSPQSSVVQSPKLTVSPNPAKDHFSLSFGEEFDGNLHISLKNLSGTTLQTKQVAGYKDGDVLRFDFNLSAGIYLLMVQTKDDVLTSKIIVE